MKECSTKQAEKHGGFTSRTVLAAIGMKIRKMGILDPIEGVKVAQKTVKDTPAEKLTDGLIAILAGAQGMVEINKRVRSDPVLQAAFGRKRCAEQSVVQQTLDACTSENVEQMEQAMVVIFRQQSQAYRHNYDKEWQIIDVDLTGRPCGAKAMFATKGYFENERNRRGRQIGYVVASGYHEIVVERVYEGKMHLTEAFQPLCQAAQEVMELDEKRRKRTILRVDSGGGSVADINWALEQGYEYHGKDYASMRVKQVGKEIQEWIADPKESGREVGWAKPPEGLYVRPMRRIAVRCRKKNGQWGIGLILSSLSPEYILWLTGQPPELINDPLAVLLAYVYFYDQRGGSVEIEIKADKQGLGTTKRNKKRFHAQQMVCLLEMLAHNLLIWVRRWLAPHCSKIARFGILRLVRDVLHLNGRILRNPSGERTILLNPADPLSHDLYAGLAVLLADQHIAVILDEN